MKQIKTKILQNTKMGERFYKIRIESAYLSKVSRPGQFIEVRCSDGVDPLLRRPLGVHRILESGIEMLYEVVGKGTEALAQRKAGEALDVIGPLGKGFDIRGMRGEGRRTIIVAGGIGAAPLVALAERLAYSVERIAYSEKRKIYVFIGARTKSHILCEKEFKKAGAEVYVSTDDGSYGYKGFISDLLKEKLNAKRYSLNAIIYACGPTGMLKAVAKIAAAKDIPCQVSLEERMACGVGVCLGCPVKVRTQYEYKMVCKDGPVFNAEDIIW
ncbi:MAG: dihydroorotate dehydrogenase electron transfer subunit [Candidatus Omnitrophota bacterium]|nr:dihydroorotate dehydrogenase electron transfer subunit [Candidatus Omnitrophota bacterium]